MSYPMDNRVAKGTAIYTRRVISEIQSGSDIFYLAHYEKNKMSEYDKPGFEEIIIPAKLFSIKSRFLGQLKFFWDYRKKPFDTIVWFQARLYPFFWLAPAKRKVAVFHAAGDITAPRSFFSFSREVFNWTLKLFGNRLDAVIAVSDFARAEIIEHYGISPEKVHVTYNGGGENYKPLDKTTSQEKVATKYGIKPPYLLNISRFQPHKNVERVVQAYEEFKDNNPGSAHSLVLVGTPVRGYDLPIQLVKKSKFTQSIKIIDYVEEADLNDLYSGADVFLFPSLNEGFGLPLLEAMASGTPTVTSNVTSLPEIAGGAAYCADPCDASDIARGIEFCRTQVESSRMIQAGLERAKGFTWKKTAESLIELC